VEKDLSEMWCAIAHPSKVLRVWLSFRLALDWQFFTPRQLASPACHTAKMKEYKCRSPPRKRATIGESGDPGRLVKQITITTNYTSSDDLLPVCALPLELNRSNGFLLTLESVSDLVLGCLFLLRDP
jgi:hypothetical protein